MIKHTQLGSSYWSKNGAYQKECDQLYQELVPFFGDAETVNGELIRIINRLFYEYCNNGNQNAIIFDDSDYNNYYDYNETNDDSGTELNTDITEPEIEEYYLEMINFIENNTECSVVELKNFMKSTPNCSFDDNEMDIYNKICDQVIYHVLNTEDKPNPSYKEES